MIKLRKNRSGGKYTVTIDGDLTIECAVEFKKALEKAVESKGLIIDMERVTQLDLSCLQLLRAARQSLVTQDKQLEIKGGLPENIENWIQDAGYGALV